MNEHLVGQYHGERRRLFKLAIWTGFLTLITLGVYRFWAKTRIRKYIWSATSAGEDSFEYTGTGLEKFLGFLVAVVILAIYLGIIQMALSFFGLNLIGEATTLAGQIAQALAFYIAVFAVMPLILFARYRARRYKAARTRWRGIRFGMESAAWGFVLRAIGHYVVSILTLGLLLPRQTFGLEKYMVDRTWYGTERFVQGGRWQSLYPGMKHIFIGLGIVILFGFGGMYLGKTIVGLLAFFVGWVWLMIGVAYYRVHTLNYMAKHKSLGEKIGFSSDADTTSILGIYLKGGLAVLGTLILASILFSVVIGPFYFSFPPTLDDLQHATGSLAALTGAVTYVATLLAIGALLLVWITQPVIAHVVGGIVLYGAEHLEEIQQRAADEGADAEGFADALDVGGGI